MAALPSRTRIKYSGVGLSFAREVEVNGFESGLIKLLNMANLVGDHEVVLTNKRNHTDDLQEGFYFTGNTRFSVEGFYLKQDIKFCFYIKIPLGNTPENILKRILETKLASSFIEKAPEKPKEPTRVHSFNPDAFSKIASRRKPSAPKVKPKKIGLERKVSNKTPKTKVEKPKPEIDIIAQIAKKYKIPKTSSLSELEKLADRAFAASDWKNLAEINEAIDKFEP